MELLYVEMAAISVFISMALLIEWGVHWCQDEAAMDLVHVLLADPQRTFGLSQKQRRRMRYYQSSERLFDFVIVFLIWLIAMGLVIDNWTAWLDYSYLYLFVLTGLLALRWHFSRQLHYLLVDTYGIYNQAAKIFEAEKKK